MEPDWGAGGEWRRQRASAATGSSSNFVTAMAASASRSQRFAPTSVISFTPSAHPAGAIGSTGSSGAVKDAWSTGDGEKDMDLRGLDRDRAPHGVGKGQPKQPARGRSVTRKPRVSYQDKGPRTGSAGTSLNGVACALPKRRLTLVPAWFDFLRVEGFSKS